MTAFRTFLLTAATVAFTVPALAQQAPENDPARFPAADRRAVPSPV